MRKRNSINAKSRGVTVELLSWTASAMLKIFCLTNLCWLETNWDEFWDAAGLNCQNALFFSFSARLSCYAGKLYWKKILLLQKMWFVDSFCHQNKSFSFCMIFLLSQSNFLKVSKKIWANQIIKFYDDRMVIKGDFEKIQASIFFVN